jgi:hypothetical protein
VWVLFYVLSRIHWTHICQVLKDSWIHVINISNTMSENIYTITIVWTRGEFSAAKLVLVLHRVYYSFVTTQWIHRCCSFVFTVLFTIATASRLMNDLKTTWLFTNSFGTYIVYVNQFVHPWTKTLWQSDCSRGSYFLCDLKVSNADLTWGPGMTSR